VMDTERFPFCVSQQVDMHMAYNADDPQEDHLEI